MIAAARKLCQRCERVEITWRHSSGMCKRCYRAAKALPSGYRNPCGTTWDVPPPSVDPTRETRIMRYQARAEAGLPLFDRQPREDQ